MEELYKEYGGVRGLKVNNVINKDLIFSFNRKPMRTSFILFPIVVLVYSILAGDFQFLWIEIFFMGLLILNKILTYKIYFEEEKMVIKNLFNSRSIYYKNGIRIFMRRKGDYGANSFDKIFFKEGYRRYNLVIEYDSEYITLTSAFSENSIFASNMKNEIEKFINNFTFEEDKTSRRNADYGIRFSI